MTVEIVKKTDGQGQGLNTLLFMSVLLTRDIFGPMVQPIFGTGGRFSLASK